MARKESFVIKLFLRNPVFANILMFVLIVGGLMGSSLMVRESFPDFELDILTVTVPYPSADPEEVEEGICQPLEDALEGIGDVKRIYTQASEGAGVAVIEVTENGDVEKVKADVRTEVDAITTFPDNAEKPAIRELSFEQDVLNLMLWGDVSERQLKEMSRTIKDDLELIDGVSRVVVFGMRDYEVAIELSEERLRQYGLQFSEVSRAIRQSSLNLPGGTLRTRSEDLKIRILGRRYYAREFHDIPIRALPNGTMLRLSDVATIREDFDQNSEFYAMYNGRPCARIQVKKTKHEDAIRISMAVREYLTMKRQQLPPTVQLSIFFDVSRLVEDRLNLLKWNGLVGLGLVFLSLWLFLDLRMSWWVTAGIPISVAGALMVMYLTGQTLNMLSMFGLIMVLGIIVDDAIVVGEAIYVHRSRGESPRQAAALGMQEVLWPVVTAVLTTIFAFVPLLFVQGITGKFIGVLPGPVIAALGVSLLEALLILPVHLRHLPRQEEDEEKARRLPSLLQFPGKVRHFTSNGMIWFARKIYCPILVRMLQWRYISLAIAIALLLMTSGLVASGILKYQFFPKVDGDLVIAQVEMQQGTPVRETERVSRRLHEAWLETEAKFKPRFRPHKLGLTEKFKAWILNANDYDSDKDPENPKLSAGVFALVGGTQGDFGTVPGSHLTTMFIELYPAEYRGIHYLEILEDWRKRCEPIPGATKVTFSGVHAGPPGDNVQIELRSRDQDQLVKAQTEFMEYLKSYAGVYEVTSTYAPGKRELRIHMKDEAHNLGLTLDEIALQLRQGFYGDEATRIQRDGDDVKIMLRYPALERISEAQLDQLRIRTQDGREIPFRLVASIERGAGHAVIRREDGLRAIQVSAEVDKSVEVNDVVKDLMASYLPRLQQKYGVTFGLGPEARDRAKSMSSLGYGAVIAAMMILLLTATVFKSYLQPFVIMLTIPFGLMGAIVAHLLYGALLGRECSLTFMSLLGMVALCGIVVNDSIVLIVAVNDRLRDGTSFMKALEEAGQRRFRAIILTSLTTFCGLFPLIMEKSFQAQVLIPMAISIAFGVVFGTMSTLILIPCMLAILNDLRRFFWLFRKLEWPTREEVELSGLSQDDDEDEPMSIVHEGGVDG